MRKIYQRVLQLLALFIVLMSHSHESMGQDSDVVYTMVDHQPQYPGGMSALFKYLKGNMQYPSEAIANNVSGRIFVDFVVEKDGSLSNVRILKGLGSGCDEEALRLFTNCQKWSPGIQKEQAVRVKMALPLQFQLPQ